jgi:hypothetical protein
VKKMPWGKIIGWPALVLAILVFFPQLALEIHEPSGKHLWNVIGNIAMIVISIALIREKKTDLTIRLKGTPQMPSSCKSCFVFTELDGRLPKRSGLCGHKRESLECCGEQWRYWTGEKK